MDIRDSSIPRASLRDVEKMGVIKQWVTLLQLFRRRVRGVADYRRFQIYQGMLVLDYLRRQGIQVAGQRLLDAGCGWGGYGYVLSRAGARVVSVDFKPPEIDLSRLAVGDAMRLPFGDHSFSLVFCASLIEHVSDPARLLAETKRVLEPEGIIYLSFPPFYSPGGGHDFKPYHLLGERLAIKLSGCKKESFATCYEDFGLYPLTIQHVRSLIAEAGLRIAHESTRFLPFNMSRIPILGEFLTWHVQFLLFKY